MRALNTLLFVCIITIAYSQSLELKGTIIDINTKEPIPFASVYFNKTTNGVDTDENSKFEIKVNPAFRELVISYLGYNTFSYKVDLTTLDQPIIFELEPNNQLEEVEIVLKRGENWYLDLERFKENFLGISTFALNSKILNPKVLQFSYDEKNRIFYANASAPLKIRNKALGYEIEYDLKEYQNFQNIDKVFYYGYPKFTEMEGSPAKQKKWTANRLKAYKGSKQHFFKAIYNRNTKIEGFEIRRLKRYPNRNRPSDEEIQKAKLAAHEFYKTIKKGNVMLLPDSIQSILSAGKAERFVEELDAKELDYSKFIMKDSNNTISLMFEDYWQINYNNESPDIAFLSPVLKGETSKLPQVSIISLEVDKVKIDSYGLLTDPLGVLYEKYFAFEKVADMLPIDYLPNK